jgi:hypothetical protein
MFKKFVSFGLVLTFILTGFTSVMASEQVNVATNETVSEALQYLQSNHVTLETDLTNPIPSQSNIMTFSDGSTIETTIEFVTNTNGLSRASSNPASAGTWSAKCSVGIYVLAYNFDLEKSGSYWKISNARNLSSGGAFTSTKCKSLTIGRALETSTFAAEVTGSADVSFFDNQWISILECTFNCITKVKDNTVTTTF